MNPDWPSVEDLRSPRNWSRKWLLRGVVLLVIVALLVPTAVSAFTYEPTTLQRGTIESPANGTTVISVQGFKIAGKYSKKKPARAVGVGPKGRVKWIYNGSKDGIRWFYDVDPVRNGSAVLFNGAGRVNGESKTFVTVWDPSTRETIWTRTFDWHDTHDVDLINGDQLLVANMRNYNETTRRNNDRLLIYDLSKGKIVWEWLFRKHGYERSGGGDYTDDWTHVNDVDKLGPGRYLASPRNFDQVIVVDRSTKNVTLQLGRDEAHSVMYEQHNPQYLLGEGGTPTILVADSGNDRVVEYAKTNGTWTRTWRLGSSRSLAWPRDADRLPNGNTLVTDTLNHRVIEVTPTGEVVWEFYAPWGTYDAERIRLGDEPGGPTIREQNATGRYRITGSAGLTPGTGDSLTFSQWLTNAFAGTPIDDQVEWLATRWAHITPWIRPVWMGPWDFVRTILAGLLAIGWLAGEGVYHRRLIWSRLQGVAGRVPPLRER
ncbi:MAG: aryl-sulfate sulfotransferase [Haloarculaceae archaeon]